MEDTKQTKERVFVDKPRNWDDGTLFHLLCNRYNVSYHVTKEKLIELVTQELSI